MGTRILHFEKAKQEKVTRTLTKAKAHGAGHHRLYALEKMMTEGTKNGK